MSEKKKKEEAAEAVEKHIIFGASSAGMPKRLEVPDPFAKARAYLVIPQPFLRTILFSLEPYPTEDIETCATDGRYLFANPNFVSKLSLEEQQYCLAHEAMHVVLLHPFRRNGRHAQKWNVACDFAINSGILDEFGMTAPKAIEACRDSKFKDKNADQIYRLLPPVQEIKIKVSMCSGVLEQAGESKGEGEGSAAEQQVIAVIRRAAAAQRQQGTLPAGLEALLSWALDPKVDWRRLLWELVRSRTMSDYSYRRMNRRLLPQNIFLPTLYSESAGKLVFVMDTSGSVSDEEISQFVSEAQAILDVIKPSELIMVQCDAAISKNGISRYRAGDSLPASFPIVGRGGTSFKPPFEWVDRELADPPDMLVYLTDLCGDFPSKAPSYPVLWVSTVAKEKAPFGRTVHMDLA